MKKICPFFQPIAIPEKSITGVQINLRFTDCLLDKCMAYNNKCMLISDDKSETQSNDCEIKNKGEKK